MLDIRSLRYFLAAAQAGNMTKAAENIFVTQSALSRQIKELEEKLGKKLFVRHPRGLDLTEDGRFLLGRAREILDLADRTEKSLKGADENLQGPIELALGETVAMSFLSEAMARFREEHPKVQFRLHSTDGEGVKERLRAGLADIGLVIGPHQDPKFDYLDLERRDEYGLLIRSDSELAAAPSIPREELKRLPLLVPDQIITGNQHLDWLGLNWDEMNVAGVYNLLFNASFLVKSGIGCAFCLDKIIQEREGLTFRPLNPPLTLSLFLIKKKYQTLSPQARKFLEVLEKRIEESRSRAPGEE